MEFERALFRVHERTLRSESVRGGLLLAERCLPWALLLLVVDLVNLHCLYVGSARCLPAALQSAGLWNATSGLPSLPEDSLLRLSVRAWDASGVGDAAAIWSSSWGTNDSGADGWRPIGPSSGGAHNVSGGGDPPVEVYRFAADPELALLKPAFISRHGFREHNVSVLDSCLAPSWRLRTGFQYFAGGYASLVVNEVAFTFRSRGYLEQLRSGEERVDFWVWTLEHFQSFSPAAPRSLVGAAARKAYLLGGAIVASAVLSAVTGMFVRVAVDGSAMLMFPMAMLSQLWGPGGTPIGVLTRNFPWVGVHVEVLRRASWPLTPLFRARIAFLALSSFSYLACNLAWKLLFYRKNTPDSFEEGVFSLVSLLELFGLIFVRSRRSMAVFPKLAFAGLVHLHLYTFCTFYPCFGLALSACCVFCLYVMVYCLNNFEDLALRGDPFAFDTPTVNHPRALYVPQLSPSWTLEAAPLWTAFYAPEPPEAFPQTAMQHVMDEEYAMP